VATPVGAYAPAVRTGTQVWTSGQLPFVAGRLLQTGTVGGEVTADEAAQAARTAALNAVAAVAQVLAAESGDAPVEALDRVVRVVKVTGFVASDPGFTAQPAVLDAASTLLRDIFGDAGVHVRSAVGVAALPLGSPVEVELVVETRLVETRPETRP
jgi:enamine deaminase RidA (YjgF/YER057c/UK114 family)